MGTWVKKSYRLDPWSYQNLMMKTLVLRETNPKATESTAVRYILRRLRFTDDQKRAYRRRVDEALESGKPDVYKAILEMRENPGLRPTKREA